MSTNRIASALGRKFSFTIVNGHATDTKTIALLGAYFNRLAVAGAAENAAPVLSYKNKADINAAGYTCDYVLDDGTLETNVTVTAANSKFKVRDFIEYIKFSGGLICQELTIAADNTSFFNNTIEVIKATPLTGSAPQYLDLQAIKSLDQQDDKRIILRNLNLEMAFDTVMLMPVPAGRTVTITFNF